MKIDPASHTIFTDASLSGWGAHVEPEGLLFHGLWTEDQSRLHINVLEMKAILLSLTRAIHKVKNSTVLVSTDNTTVVAYIRHQGGTHSTVLTEEVWNILNLCLTHNIQLLVKHIPGRFNTLADRMSRIDKPISTEWSLNQEIPNKIFQIMDFPSIDLFATVTSEPQAATICVTHTGSEGAINRCHLDGLESHTRLCVSTVSSHSNCDKQNTDIPVQNSIDSSFMARQSMVSRTPRSVGVTTGISASNAKSACSAKRQNSASKSRSSTTSRLGIVKQSLRDKQFSSEVAEHVSKARRVSTVKVYDAKWQIFRDWANERKIDPIQATPQIVADFLTFLFSVKKCQVSTIRGYRSTISNTLKFRTGYDFGSHPVLSELIKSFAKQRPVDQSLAPKWDLAFVLSHMCKAPFEPLDKLRYFIYQLRQFFLSLWLRPEE